MKTTYERVMEKISSISEYKSDLPKEDLDRALGIKKNKRFYNR